MINYKKKTSCQYLLTYLLHGAESLRSYPVLQLIKKFPAFYGTWKFITVLTSARQLSLSWANSIQSPQPLSTSWRSTLILSFHLCLGLPNGLFPSGFPTKTLCTPLPSSIVSILTRSKHSFIKLVINTTISYMGHNATCYRN